MVLKNVYTNLTALIREARNTEISASLAVFKPTRIINFHVRRADSKEAYLARKKMLSGSMDKQSAAQLAEHVKHHDPRCFKRYHRMTIT